MKKIFRIAISVLFLLPVPGNLIAQDEEVAQLALNLQKLRQLESILDNMYKGYKILTKGYNAIKDISEGNFNLHQVFLDGLFEVNPKIRDYHKIPQIIRYQQLLVKEYKQSWNYLKDDQNLTPEELDYIEKVYSGLFKQSLKDLDELIMATTASKLRMSDDERLQAIDRIFADMEDKLAFLRYFNNGARLLCLQRAKSNHDVAAIRKLHSVDK
jgi:hypothetical protein